MRVHSGYARLSPVVVKNDNHEYVYNTERICDSIRKTSKSLPLIYVWICKNVPHVKRVYNTYSFPDVIENEVGQTVNIDGTNPPVDAYGLAFAGRPIIWFVDNQFLRLTNLSRKYVSRWGHDTTVRKQIKTDGCGLDAAVLSNDTYSPTLDRIKYVYVTDQQNAWKKHLLLQAFEECNPVTILLYTKAFADRVLKDAPSDMEAINSLGKLKSVTDI